MSIAPDRFYQRHRLTVEEYFRMGENCVFQPEARLELIEGEIIDMPPIGPTHSGTITRLNRLLTFAALDKAIVSIQNPVILGDLSAPQPDIAVLAYRADFYTTAHPYPKDILLIIEVADSTLRYDCNVKAPLYAKYGIPEVWIVDLEHSCVHRFRQPADTGYQQVDGLSEAETLTPQLVPECTISHEQLFV